MIDIKDKLTAQEKQAFENLRVETQVLQNLLNERRGFAQQFLEDILQKLGYNTMLYGFEFNFGQNKWEIQLRPDAIVLPGVNPNPRFPKNPKKPLI